MITNWRDISFKAPEGTVTVTPKRIDQTAEYAIGILPGGNPPAFVAFLKEGDEFLIIDLDAEDCERIAEAIGR